MVKTESKPETVNLGGERVTLDYLLGIDVPLDLKSPVPRFIQAEYDIRRAVILTKTYEKEEKEKPKNVHWESKGKNQRSRPSRWATAAATALLALNLVGCSTTGKKIEEKCAYETQEKEKAEEETKPKEQEEERKVGRVVLTYKKFSEYAPTAQKTRVDITSKTLGDFLEKGSDWEESKIEIEDRSDFWKNIIAEAEKLGYSEGKVKSLNIKESIELACKLTASRLNYMGTKSGNESDKRLAELEELKNKAQDEEQKRNVDELIELEKVAKKWGGIANSGIIVGARGMEYDRWSIDKLFKEAPEIICRHYARVAAGIFGLLKEKNENLVNTFMTCYSNPTLQHLWNEVVTLSQENKRLKIEGTFVDPTFLDSMNRIEGFDPEHLGKASIYHLVGTATFYERIAEDFGKEEAELAIRLYDRGEKTEKWFELGMDAAHLVKKIGGDPRERYNALAKRLPDGDKRLMYIADAMGTKNPEDVVNMLRRCLGSEECGGRAREKIASFYAVVGDMKKSMEVLDEIDDDPKTEDNEKVETMELIGGIARARKDYDTALTLFRKCYEKERKFSYAANIALTLAKKGDVEEGVRMMDNITDDPTTKENEKSHALFVKAMVYEGGGKTQQAVEAFKTFLDAPQIFPTVENDETIFGKLPDVNKMLRDDAVEYIKKNSKKD